MKGCAAFGFGVVAVGLIMLGVFVAVMDSPQAGDWSTMFYVVGGTLIAIGVAIGGVAIAIASASRVEVENEDG